MTSKPNGSSPFHRTPPAIGTLIGQSKPIQRVLQVCVAGDRRRDYDAVQYVTNEARDALRYAEASRAAANGPKGEREDAPPGAMRVGDSDPDQATPEAEDEPDAPVPTERDIARLRRNLANALQAEEAARQAMLERTYDITVRSFPGGTTALNELGMKHSTGDELFRFDDQGQPVRNKAGEHLKQYTLKGEPARSVDEPPYYAELFSLAVVEPKMTEQQAGLWIDALGSDATRNQIGNLIRNATEEVAMVPMSRLARGTRQA